VAPLVSRMVLEDFSAKEKGAGDLEPGRAGAVVLQHQYV